MTTELNDLFVTASPDDYALAAKSSFVSNEWRPGLGNNVMRLLPALRIPGSTDVSPNFGSALTHNVEWPDPQNKNNKNFDSIRCTNTGQPGTCAVCDLIDALQKTPGVTNAQLAILEKWSARRDTVFRLVDRNERVEPGKLPTIYFWAAPQSVRDGLKRIAVQLASNPQVAAACSGDVAHPLYGFDISVSKEGTGIGTKYSASIPPGALPTPLLWLPPQPGQSMLADVAAIRELLTRGANFGYDKYKPELTFAAQQDVLTGRLKIPEALVYGAKPASFGVAAPSRQITGQTQAAAGGGWGSGPAHAPATAGGWGSGQANAKPAGGWGSSGGSQISAAVPVEVEG